MQKTFDLPKEAREKILIAAHRGIFGGNIPCNTIAAFDAALYLGADMVELDVGKSADGEFFVFHEGCERAHLGCEKPFTLMTAKEIRSLRYLNQDKNETEHGVNTLDEVFEHLKGRCYINVDKFASYMRPIAEAVRRHGMLDQVVVKTPAKMEYFEQIAQAAPDLSYIAIIKQKDIFTKQILASGVRLIGVEAVFETEDAPVCQPEYIEAMHQKGLILWGNGIVYSYRAVLSAGRSDDISITGQPDEGWGWLADRRFDIIQTDWPSQLRQYLGARGVRV